MKSIPLPKTINAHQMHHVNRSAILELMRQHSPIARSEISNLLDISLPTTMRIVDELITYDLVRLTGETAGNIGRPRELLEFNKNGGVVIGIDLGGTKLFGALASIGGEVIDEVYQNQYASSDNENFDLVVDTIQTLIDLAKDKNQKLLGIAIGAPGVTRIEKGIVEWAPSLNWRDFPIKARLVERFHLPVVVDNDVNLAVLGEQWFGVGRGVNNILLLSIGTGLGAGLIIDGLIYRGHNESAGEVGYFLPSIQALNISYDKFGAMERIVSEIGIVNRAHQLLSDKISKDQLAAINARDVFEAARIGQDWGKQIVAETIDHLSMVIANVSTLLDPELVILSGGIMNSTDLFIPPILDRLDGIIQHIPRIEGSSLGSRATAMGAISRILQLIEDYYVVRRVY